jgi:hypothetical protein
MAPEPPIVPPLYRAGSRSRSNVGWVRLILKGSNLVPYAMTFGETPEECDAHADHIIGLLNASVVTLN